MVALNNAANIITSDTTNNTAEIINSAETIIKEFEGYRASRYRDIAGIWTIGYGFTFWSGQEVTASYPAGSVSIAQCDQQLRAILIPLLSNIRRVVSVSLSDNQYAALLSFSYNIGYGRFCSSTMLRLINQNQLQAASAQFPLWDRAAGVVVAGLLKRRQAEQKLFNT